MPKSNPEIAELFDRLADLLDVEDANPFRVRAYRNAARVIRGESRSMTELVESGFDLDGLPGIGEGIAEKIHEIVDTGRLSQLDKIAKRTPLTLSDLIRLPGLGPKRVKTLYRQLNIRSADDLRRAARKHKIRELPGFGETLEHKILDALDRYARGEHRWYLAEAEAIAAPLVNYLQKLDGVGKVTVAGSYRRRKETVGDLDILVTCRKGVRVAEYFVAYDEVESVDSQGDTRASVQLESGIQVDLRVVPAASYGAALYYFTGSKAHNVAVRGIAVKRGLKINEYGVFRDGERIAGRSEKEVFASVELPYIEPELREDRGEIEAARKGGLPELVTIEAIRGDLHSHTNATDGRESLESMAQAARKRGYDYLAITDHTRQVQVAHGQQPEDIEAQLDVIDEYNARNPGLRLLKSAEVDILEDGGLDLPDSILRRLDLVLCALHYRFELDRKAQTRRLLKAMDNPHCQILAHPLARLINEREPLDIDLQRILEHAAAAGCAMEINGQPARLDLPDVHVQYARSLGVKFVLSTDAHSTGHLDYMRYAVDQARRGWLQAGDVLNTRPLQDFLAALRHV